MVKYVTYSKWIVQSFQTSLVIFDIMKWLINFLFLMRYHVAQTSLQSGINRSSPLFRMMSNYCTYLESSEIFISFHALVVQRLEKQRSGLCPGTIMWEYRKTLSCLLRHMDDHYWVLLFVLQKEKGYLYRITSLSVCQFVLQVPFTLERVEVSSKNLYQILKFAVAWEWKIQASKLTQSRDTAFLSHILDACALLLKN